MYFLYFITELSLEASLQSRIYYMVPRPGKNFVFIISEFKANQNGGSIRKKRKVRSEVDTERMLQ